MALLLRNDPNIDGILVNEKNYQELLIKAKSVLTKWKNRSASLFAKIIIVNVLMASLFVYRMTVLPKIPNKYLRELKENIDKFLWNNSRPKIKQEILCLPKDKGGVKLINFEAKNKALKITWIQI